MIRRLFLNDNFILAIIILNAFTIMLSAFDNISPKVTQAITIADNSITILFIIELIVKTSSWGFLTYLKSNWNKMDFILILLSVPALVSWIFGLPLTGLSFFLVFRVLRVFKSFRFIKFIPGINDLISGISRALKTSFIILLGFAIYIFIIGILSCYLYRNAAPEFFGDPIISFYSIFKIFTMEGWTEIPETIALNSSEAIAVLTKIYFVIILISGGIFGLSLVNSILVDAMLSDNTEDIEKKIDGLDDRFNKLDDKINSLLDSMK
ncbi:MAG: ion transporter [Bacteroidales bacterium]|nr:ion transporter [Bacteroidales bacterium]